MADQSGPNRPTMPEPIEPPDPRKFYVVWSPQGGPPVVRYPSFESARIAASRLSLKIPGQDFFVLASCWERIGATATEPVEIERDAADDPTTKPESAP
jgi:hypothetical protein